jgi:Primosomal replication protein N
MKANQFLLDAIVVEKAVLRYTPTGMPVQELTLTHRSQQEECGSERQAEFELFAIAFGETAKKISEVDAQQALKISGFLTRRWRTGITLALHIVKFKLLNEQVNELTER